jgi:hypothetical protein
VGEDGGRRRDHGEDETMAVDEMRMKTTRRRNEHQMNTRRRRRRQQRGERDEDDTSHVLVRSERKKERKERIFSYLIDCRRWVDVLSLISFDFHR